MRGPRLQPAPLKAQVFLVGPPEVIALLEEDEEFLELFPFRVEFNPEMPYTEAHVAHLGGFLEAQGCASSRRGSPPSPTRPGAWPDTRKGWTPASTASWTWPGRPPATRTPWAGKGWSGP